MMLIAERTLSGEASDRRGIVPVAVLTMGRRPEMATPMGPGFRAQVLMQTGGSAGASTRGAGRDHRLTAFCQVGLVISADCHLGARAGDD
jgi:hypothetical protein